MSTSTAETGQPISEVACKICGKTFSRTGLGGHTSKAHPNESAAYKAKMQKREERIPERAMLAEAKNIFASLGHRKENRKFQTAIKDTIRNAMDPEAIDVLQEITKASKMVLKNLSV